MLGLSKLIHRFLFINLLFIFISFFAFADNRENINLFTLAISDNRSSKILNFFKEVEVEDPYEMIGGSRSLQSQPVFKEMIDHVYEYNPDILIAREDIGIADEGRKQAFGAFLPKFDSALSASSTRKKDRLSGEMINDDFNSGSLNVTQPLFKGGTLYNGYRKSQESLEATKFQEESVVQNLFLEAINAHLDVLETQAVAAVSKRSSDVFYKLDAETKAKFKSGLVTKVDLSQSKARLRGAEADLDQAFSNYQKAQKFFEKIVGLSAVPEANIPDIQFKELIDFDELEKLVLVFHPLIQKAQKELEAAKREINAKFGVLLPSADASLAGTKNFNAGKLPTRFSSEAKLQISFPIFNGGIDYSAYKQAKIEYQRALHQLDIARRNVKDNLNAARYDYEIAQKVIDARFEEVRATKIAFQGIRQELVVGKKSVLDTLNAESDFLDANIAYLKASFAQERSIFRYIAAIGCLNYNILSQAIANNS